MKKPFFKTTILASLLLVAGSVRSTATPVLAVSIDGITYTTIAIDEGAGDGSAGAGLEGVVTRTLAGYHGWSVTVIGGLTKPVPGYTAANALMDLSVDASYNASGGPGNANSTVLYIAFSENGFTPVPGGYEVIQTGSATSGAGTGEVRTFSGGGAGLNTELDMSNPLLTLGPLANSFNTSGSTGNVPSGAPYSLTIVQILTSTALSPAGATTFSTDASIQASVPDGGSTLMLLGAALSGMGLLRLRAIRKV